MDREDHVADDRKLSKITTIIAEGLIVRDPGLGTSPSE
jgi:hypothetical protein